MINFLASTQFENNAVYNGTEVQQILNTANHGSLSRYYRQTAAALGLARWDSGKPGGAWESIPGAIHGNGDNRVDSWELTWVEPYFDQPGSRWLDYVQWAASSWSRMEDANGDFRYAFGPKTFTNFLMEQRFSHEQTPELAATPHQPMQAVKDAVELMDAVASMANGEHLQATSNIISEYQADLQEIFVRLGGKRPVELIQ